MGRRQLRAASQGLSPEGEDPALDVVQTEQLLGDVSRGQACRPLLSRWCRAGRRRPEAISLCRLQKRQPVTPNPPDRGLCSRGYDRGRRLYASLSKPDHKVLDLRRDRSINARKTGQLT